MREGEFHVHMDDPAGGVAQSPVFQVRGWFAIPLQYAPRRVCLQIQNVPLRWRPIPRPDVLDRLPHFSVAGFLVDLNLYFYLGAVKNGTLELVAVPEGMPRSILKLSVPDSLLHDCVAAVSTP
jgi:hypothetical protein